MKKKFIIGVIIYLLLGVTFYVVDTKNSREVVRLCPPGLIAIDQVETCQSQRVFLKEDWPTAISLTVGWLPLLIVRALVRL